MQEVWKYEETEFTIRRHPAMILDNLFIYLFVIYLTKKTALQCIVLNLCILGVQRSKPPTSHTLHSQLMILFFPGLHSLVIFLIQNFKHCCIISLYFSCFPPAPMRISPTVLYNLPYPFCTLFSWPRLFKR